jgi:hypothetical protein
MSPTSTLSGLHTLLPELRVVGSFVFSSRAGEISRDMRLLNRTDKQAASTAEQISMTI